MPKWVLKDKWIIIMKIDFSRVTDINYREVIEKCQPLIGKTVKPYNLPILYIAAMNFKVMDEVYETMFTMRHSQNQKDWKIMTEQELKLAVEEIQNQTWPSTFLQIVAFFRNENTGRVYVDYLEHVL